MKRITGHKEPWGTFVDVKINAAELLRKEIFNKKKATVWISGVCDPYQPLENIYNLTRQCLQILTFNDWPVVVQTRSPLIMRDVDIIKEAKNVEVGYTITTADDNIRKLFEPTAPSIPERLNALAELHALGIRTYAMVAPILPGAEKLINLLGGYVDYILLDRMNYHYADFIYRKYGLVENMTEEYFTRVCQQIRSDCLRLEIECSIVF